MWSLLLRIFSFLETVGSYSYRAAPFFELSAEFEKRNLSFCGKPCRAAAGTAQGVGGASVEPLGCCVRA